MDLAKRLDELQAHIESYPANARPLAILREIRDQLAADPSSDGSGSALIAVERRRQLSEEGWDAKHDDHHDRSELTAAAICYAADAAHGVSGGFLAGGVYALRQMGSKVFSFVDPWPWDPKYDKRHKHSTTKKLAIAGALIAAEIDRVIREVDAIGRKAIGKK
jgi:hypothetical protein